MDAANSNGRRQWTEPELKQAPASGAESSESGAFEDDATQGGNILTDTPPGS